MQAGLLQRDALVVQSSRSILSPRKWIVQMDHDPLQLEEFTVTTVLDGAFVTRVSAP